MVYQKIENQSHRRLGCQNTPSKWRCKQKKAENRYAAFVRRMNEENERYKKYWNDTLLILKTFQTELLALGKPPSYNKTIDNIKYCVELFKIVSTAQDAIEGDIIQICPADKRDVVKAFNNDLFFAGRHADDELRNDTYHGKVPYWNTSKAGEAITMDTICFGPDIGLPRKPASYWIKLSKKKRVYMTIQISYEKGKLERETTAWATEALVKTGINNFINVAYEAFSTELEALLDNE